MFAQMLGEEVIGPKKKELAYQEKFIGNLKEGKYIIKGILTTANGPFEAKVPIKVEG